MGQQLSGESYCRATIQKLLAELNTTNSRVSESHVTSDSGGGGGAAAVCVDFTWREWARVSKYLERVLPAAEQKRLLNHVLLDRTGLRHCREEAAAATTEYGYEYTEATPRASNGHSGGGAGKPGWTLHVNYGDDDSRNPVLYRDFVKLHFQLDEVPATVAATNSEGENGVADRLADLVKRCCGSIGINLLVTRARHHIAESCVSVSGTVDVRSVLRNAQQLELHSRLNPSKAEDQELSDQLMRSAAGLRDRIDGAAAAAAVAASAPAASASVAASAAAAAAAAPPTTYRYFPMRLSYSEDTHRVTLVYAMEASTAKVPSTSGVSEAETAKQADGATH